ncbi:MAG: tRNA (adenosine(37)-N6)-threonylcarbamoyltransferase complex ATPase subunit type 1 TsaE [Pseudomonadota bacterium]
MDSIARQIIVNNEEESKELAQKIASNIKSGDVIAFEGDLGSGKSFFCREIIKHLCGSNTKVTSPTFNLLQTYESKNFTIYHYDLYRVEHVSELYELGLEDALSGNVVLIEWPDLALSLLPENLSYIKIEIIDETTRRISFK